MFIVHAFIVVIIAISGVIVPKSFAAEEGKPGGIIILEQLRDRFYNAAHNPALQKVTAERAFRGIATLHIPAEILPKESSSPVISKSRLPIQLEKKLHLMQRHANSYEKTLYMELFILTHLTGVNGMAILSSAASNPPYPASDDLYSRYQSHWQACVTLWGLVTGKIKPITQPTTLTVTNERVEGGKKPVQEIVEIPVKSQKLDDKYRYFDTDLHLATAKSLQDEAAMLTAYKAHKNGLSLPIIKVGFVKFMDNIRTKYNLAKLGLSQSEGCIVDGVNCRAKFSPPSIQGTLPHHYDSSLTTLAMFFLSTLSHNVNLDIDADTLSLLYDGPSLLVTSQLLQIFEEKEGKDPVDFETLPVETHSFDLGLLIAIERLHSLNHTFARLGNSNYHFVLSVPPAPKEKEGKRVVEGYKGIIVTDATKPHGPYESIVLNPNKIHGSLSRLTETIVACTHDKLTPSPEIVLLEQKLTGKGKNVEIDPYLCAIGKGENIGPFVDGQAGFVYAFENHKSLGQLVHVFDKSALAKIPQTEVIPASLSTVYLSCNTIITYTKTKNGSLIVAGQDDKGATLDLIQYDGLSQPTKKSKSIDKYTVENMIYFYPSEGPGSLLLTSPPGTSGMRVIRGIY